MNLASKSAKADDPTLSLPVPPPLNEEQERAFRIVTNHIMSTNTSPLHMYLGGRRGTRKSQVIKAIKELFELRKESHQCVVLALTGTAAALLNEDTYHHFLGLRSENPKDNVILNKYTSVLKAKKRMVGVEYIFIDECSMLSCKSLFYINERLAKVSQNFEESFRGFNMIFAGDFAQLPPVGGIKLYKDCSAAALSASLNKFNEQAIVGHFLWHQVTTAVILTRNMRQTVEGSKEASFRTALVNMHYASCTDKDIHFCVS
jgi:ATP-dependent DNA helicase PIF1